MLALPTELGFSDVGDSGMDYLLTLYNFIEAKVARKNRRGMMSRATI